MGHAHSTPSISCCNSSATIRTRLDRHSFTAGETVTGYVYLHVTQQVTLTHVEVKVKREEQTNSKASPTTTTTATTITPTGQESPDINAVTVETSTSILREKQLAPGTYAYPISLQIPSDAPPSFFVKREGAEQSVSLLYWLEAAATMDTASTHPTIVDETLLTLLHPPSHPPTLRTPPAHLADSHLQWDQGSLSDSEAGDPQEDPNITKALVQPQPGMAKHQLQQNGSLKMLQQALCGSAITVVPGSCFGSRGTVSVEVHGPLAVLRAGEALGVSLQVKNQSSIAISRLLVEVHQCGGVAEGYAPSKGAPTRSIEVSRLVASAEPLPGFAPGESKLGSAAMEATITMGRRLQGSVSGKAVRMYYALVVKAVAGKGRALELLRVPLQAADSVLATSSSSAGTPAKVAA